MQREKGEEGSEQRGMREERREEREERRENRVESRLMREHSVEGRDKEDATEVCVRSFLQFYFDIRRRLLRRRPQSARPRKTTICRSDASPDSRVAQSVGQGSRERREVRILFMKSGLESSDGISRHFVQA